MTDQSTIASPEEQLEQENKLIAQRREKLKDIRTLSNAYPNSFRRDSYAENLQSQYGEESKEALEQLGKKVSVAGRVMLNRGAFIVLQLSLIHISEPTRPS